MTKTKRWLDELPLESRERELLLVGKSAKPADGALDANWQALCVALGSTAAATGVAASGIAAKAISAKVSSSLLASQAASAGLLVMGAKSLAVGVVVGLGVMGVGAVAEHVSRSEAEPASIAKPRQAPSAPRPFAAPMSAPSALRLGEVALAPADSQSNATPGSSTQRERSIASNPALAQADTPAPTPAAAGTDQAASLSQQARELAELKRLIDGGATAEALRRLTNFSPGAVSVLSEERDALYVQALDRAQRRDEARYFARQFLVRYPHSPYFETMRRLTQQ